VPKNGRVGFVYAFFALNHQQQHEPFMLMANSSLACGNEEAGQYLRNLLSCPIDRLPLPAAEAKVVQNVMQCGKCDAMEV
jgi:hypothetical protein